MKLLIVTLLFFVTNMALAAGYYDQFIYKMTGDCNDLASIISEDTFTNDYIPLGFDKDGTELEAWMGIQLFDNGTYWAEYGEVRIGEEKLLFNKNGIEGTWIVVGDKITLSDLGHGVPGQDKTKEEVIDFTFETSFNNPILKNKTAKFFRSSVGLGPKYQTPEEYCKNK